MFEPLKIPWQNRVEGYGKVNLLKNHILDGKSTRDLPFRQLARVVHSSLWGSTPSLSRLLQVSENRWHHTFR